MNNKTTGGAAHERDALLQAAIDFIGTLTGMTPPPIEVAPPEVFAPFRAFVDRVQAITALSTTAAQPPAGFVLVPTTPTDEMVRAGYDAYGVEGCYGAMLAAAPKAEPGDAARARGLEIAKAAKEVECPKCGLRVMSNCDSRYGCPMPNIYDAARSQAKEGGAA